MVSARPFGLRRFDFKKGAGITSSFRPTLFCGLIHSTGIFPPILSFAAIDSCTVGSERHGLRVHAFVVIIQALWLPLWIGAAHIFFSTSKAQDGC